MRSEEARRLSEQLGRSASRYVREVQAATGGHLSREDAEDVVQDALVTVATTPESTTVRDPHAWFRRVLHARRADLLRSRYGRRSDGARARLAPTSLEALSVRDDGEVGEEVLADDTRVDEEVERAYDRMTAPEVLLQVLRQLPYEESALIRLRFLRSTASGDQLTFAEIGEQLGLTERQAATRFAAAWVKFVHRVWEDDSGVGCGETRLLMAQRDAGLADSEARARIAAHCAGCLHCRAYERRAELAVAALPLIAGGGLVHAAATRLLDLWDRLIGAAQHAVASVVGTAGGAGVLGALGGKVAATCAAAALCAGAAGGAIVAVPAVNRAVHHHNHRPARHAVHASSRQAATISAAQTAAPIGSPPSVTSGASSAGAPRPSKPQLERRRRGSAPEARASATPQSPVLPELTAPPRIRAASSGGPAKPRATQASAEKQPPSSPAPGQHTPRGARFTSEFTP